MTASWSIKSTVQGVPGRSVVVALLAVVGVAAIALGFRQISEMRLSSPCDDPFAEPLDPASSQHLLPGANGTYRSAAPTSGAHRPGLYPTGVLTQSIPQPVQVSMLEAGQVLIQYHDLAPEASARLKAFARAHPGVSTAPARRNAEANIVVTAWQYKMRCGDFDTKAFSDFVAAHLDEPAAH